MFVFPFGCGYYERQCAVVMAETIEEARTKLLADIDRQTPNQAHWPHGGLDGNWVGDNDFRPYWFNRDMLAKAEEAAREDGEDKDMLPYEITGDVGYVIGVDG
jgi:hypothetical protein